MIEIAEGQPVQLELLVFGFSYGEIPVQVTTLTYDQFRARGFDLTEEFSSIIVPEAAADGKLCYHGEFCAFTDVPSLFPFMFNSIMLD